MEFTKVKYNKSNFIAEITLNNPQKLNACDLTMLQELLSALEACEQDDDIKIVVISGEGSAFCAGADLQTVLESGWDNIPYLIRDMARVAGNVVLKIRNMPKPVIASMKGAAAGAGFNIALVSDFRIATDNCKFIQAFINVGLIPDSGGVFVLSRFLGVGKATELAMSGRAINAVEALSLGLINKVVALDDLESETSTFAEQLVHKPGQALRRVKTLINRHEFLGFENYLENEVEYQFECAKTEDFREGVLAFVEKRKPKFVCK